MLKILRISNILQFWSISREKSLKQNKITCMNTKWCGHNSKLPEHSFTKCSTFSRITLELVKNRKLHRVFETWSFSALANWKYFGESTFRYYPLQCLEIAFGGFSARSEKFFSLSMFIFYFKRTSNYFCVPSGLYIL